MLRVNLSKNSLTFFMLVTVNWDESIHGLYFDQIKKLMTQAPVLRFFDPKTHNVLQSDVS